MIVMQRHLGGGLRRSNRGKIGGKARGRRRVAFSVVQGRLAMMEERLCAFVKHS